MIHTSLVYFNRSYELITDEFEIEDEEFMSAHERRNAICELAYKEFEGEKPLRFKLSDGRRGIVIPVKSYCNIALNMVFFQGDQIYGNIIESGHVSRDVNTELESLSARLFKISVREVS